MSEQNIDRIARHRIAIVGRVCDRTTTVPLSKVVVELTTMPEELQKKVALWHRIYTAPQHQGLSKKRLPTLTQTMIDGFFYFTDLPAGNYELTASLPNSGTRYGAVKNVTITVMPDRPAQILSIQLPSTSLTGRVVQAVAPQDGLPMAKISIVGEPTFTHSDAEGRFWLSGLEASPNSPRIVQITAQGYESQTQEIRLSQGETTVLADIEFSRKLARTFP
ncbi:carboxypeptidase regulatory-like domain-containing protein [Pseudanabaenaceae cyanobacterium LEGE 13415]|nr:carboxypeptidase regulatory-like domain-containing protein [Pseudanabaenaceae cyanobacterium LEGE 13415]